jgi:hypothetical protein
MTTTRKKSGAGDDVGSALAPSIEIPTSITRDAVETLARRQGQPVLDVLTQLQGSAAHLDDGEVTLNALCAIKSEILDENLTKLSGGPRFPNVRVKLVGEGGNVFAIIGRVCRALRQGGANDADIAAFTAEVYAAGSYDDALVVIMGWVDVY